MDDTVLTVLLVAAAAGLLLWPMLRARLSGVAWIAVPDVQGRIVRGDDVLVLDVRSDGEFRGGHIAGAVNVPVDSLDRRIGALRDSLADHRDTAVVVVCQSGPRAVRAASMLARAGLSEVAVMRGGMGGWAAAGLPMRRGA